MYRTPAERWLERRLTARRRQDAAGRRRPTRRERDGHSAADAPASGRRALVGELIEDVVVEVATAWRHRR